MQTNYISISSADGTTIEGDTLEEIREQIQNRYDRAGGYDREIFSVYETVYKGCFRRNTMTDEIEYFENLKDEVRVT